MLRIYQVLLQAIRDLRPFIRQLEERDADLARQCKRALASGALNLAEGSYSRGKNRAARYHTALGSVREAQACFEVGAALGYLGDLDRDLSEKVDQILGTLVRLAIGPRR